FWFLLPLVAIMPPGAQADVRPGRGPLIGYVHNGTCVASTDANPASYSCTIFVGDLVGANRPSTYHYNSFKYLEYPYRWRIAHDHFWATSIQVERIQSFARIP